MKATIYHPLVDPTKSILQTKVENVRVELVDGWIKLISVSEALADRSRTAIKTTTAFPASQVLKVEITEEVTV